jgi:Flp pilus assembly pilin Flp
MQTLANLKRLWRDQDGHDMIESSLICATIVVVTLGFLPSSLLHSLIAMFARVTGNFSSS